MKVYKTALFLNSVLKNPTKTENQTKNYTTGLANLNHSDSFTFTGSEPQKSSSISRVIADWNKFSGDKIPTGLHVNPIFFNYISPSDTILDVATGSGKLLFEIADKGYSNLSGLDSNPSGISLAREEAQKKGLNIDFRVGSALNMEYPSNSFDAVSSQAFWTVVVDPHDRKNISSEISRVLKPNGIYYLGDMALTKENPLHLERYEEGVRKGYPYGTFEARNPQTGDLDYIARHYLFDELKEMLAEAKLKIIDSTLAWGKTRSGKDIKEHFIIARKIP